MSRPAILILGAGGMGARHIKAFSETGRCDVHCFDVSPEATERIGDRALLAGIFNDLSAIPVDLCAGVVIATPTDTHVRYAQWCLERDLPFLVEKPISTREDRLSELIAACDARRLTCGVAFPRRSSAAVQRLKEKVNCGQIGILKMIRCNFSQDFRKYRPDYRSTYYAKLATGGGAIMDALSHHINLACHFGGTVRKVQGFHDRLVFDDVEGEDCALINLRFSNGVLGAVHGNQFQRPNEDFIELVGSEGNLRYERVSGRLEWNASDAPDWLQEYVNGNWDAALRSQASEFLDAISGSGSIRTSLREGFHHLRVALAARRSQDEGRVIEIGE